MLFIEYIFTVMGNDYKKLISEIRNSWKELGRHPNKDTIGVDDESIRSFRANEDKNIAAIRKDLREKKYLFEKFKPIEKEEIGKDKPRILLVPTVRDRIVIKGMLDILKVRLDSKLSDNDYSLKNLTSDREIGVHNAALDIRKLIEEGYVFVFETDIENFFYSLDRKKLISGLRKYIKDKDFLNLLEQIIECDLGEEVHKNAKDSLDKGIAQGLAISPLLSSFYLEGFDRAISGLPGVRLIRYVDDLVVMAKNESDLKIIRSAVEKELSRLKLNMHPKKSDEINLKRKTFDFLGLRFHYAKITISPKTVRKHKEKLLKTFSRKSLSFAERVIAVNKQYKSFAQQYLNKGYDVDDTLEGIKKRLSKKIMSDLYKNMGKYLAINTDRISEVKKRNFSKWLGI